MFYFIQLLVQLSKREIVEWCVILAILGISPLQQVFEYQFQRQRFVGQSNTSADCQIQVDCDGEKRDCAIIVFLIIFPCIFHIHLNFLYRRLNDFKRLHEANENKLQFTESVC